MKEQGRSYRNMSGKCAFFQCFDSNRKDRGVNWMEKITGVTKDSAGAAAALKAMEEGAHVKVKGAVHSVRRIGEITFLILRRRDGLLQLVCEEGKTKEGYREVREGDTLKAEGTIRKEERSPGGLEIVTEEVTKLSESKKAFPLPVSRKKLNTSLEAKLSVRPLSLRNLRERAKFKIQEGICRAFREYLFQNGFTEIHTPKIGAKGAEGGANLFRLDYFHKKAVLEQSPQLYKQMMVGVFDRVFETGPVFRAEKHNTKRHLNEYTSLDLEMGYIDDFTDVMEVETGFLQYMTRLLEQEYRPWLDLLGARLPKTDEIPSVRFDEAKQLVAEVYQRPMRAPYDLEPEEEELIGRYFKETYGADFVFVTHYPSRKRPFYAMDDPADPKVTLSFDLLFRGLEVTTGGQRIHDYDKLTAKIGEKKMTTEGLEDYLSAFLYGMPPHGGLGIGLERLTMQLLGEENIRETCLFPRDLKRLEP